MVFCCFLRLISRMSRFLKFSYSLNKKIWDIFCFLFIVCISIEWITWDGFFSRTIKELIFALVGGVLFYLVFNTLEEKHQTTNELKYFNVLYQETKEDILRYIVVAENNGLLSVDYDNIKKGICSDPRVAQKYFTQEKFAKILINLDEKEFLLIVSKLQFFCESFRSIAYKFLKNGDNALWFIYQDLHEMSSSLEQILIDKNINSSSIYLDWVEGSSLKSTHPLYRLFCQEYLNNAGSDPRRDILLRTLDRYS